MQDVWCVIFGRVLLCWMLLNVVCFSEEKPFQWRCCVLMPWATQNWQYWPWSRVVNMYAYTSSKWPRTACMCAPRAQIYEASAVKCFKPMYVYAQMLRFQDAQKEYLLTLNVLYLSNDCSNYNNNEPEISHKTARITLVPTWKPK